MPAQYDGFENVSRKDLIRQILQLTAEVHRLRSRTVDDVIKEMIKSHAND